MIRRFVTAALPALLALGACAIACSEEESAPKFRAPSNSARPGMSSIDARARQEIKQKGAGLVESGSDVASKTELVLPKLSETDFIESVKHRDPFRPFIEVIVHQESGEQKVQREIKLKDYDISELKLIAIVTNIGDERAMVVTPANEGIVLRRGDYVGKPEYVDTGSGDKIQVNWRVARIHGSGKDEERGIYLVRDDPLTETPEDVTRFFPLHPQQ
jgi:Tfp pilus assembly protein PilP